MGAKPLTNDVIDERLNKIRAHMIEHRVSMKKACASLGICSKTMATRLTDDEIEELKALYHRVKPRRVTSVAAEK